MRIAFWVLLLFSRGAFAFEIGDSVVTVSISEMSDGSFKYALAKDSYVKTFSDKRYRTSKFKKWLIRAKDENENVIEQLYFSLIDPRINRHKADNSLKRIVGISSINLALKENLRKIEIVKDGKIIKEFLVKDLVDVRENQ